MDNQKNTSRHLKTLWRPLGLVILVALGVMLTITGVLDWQQTIARAQGFTEHWWVAALLILLQVILYTFAMPGSFVLWLVAPLYHPVIGSLILVSGSTLGALSAYYFARRETLAWSSRVRSSHIFTLLKQRGNFLTLCALRIMPNFPHSVINYGSGMLRLPIGQFLTSSMIGFSLKSYLYCKTIHDAVIASKPSELIHLNTLGPLIILTLLVVLAEYLRLRWGRTHH